MVSSLSVKQTGEISTSSFQSFVTVIEYDPTFTNQFPLYLNRYSPPKVTRLLTTLHIIGWILVGVPIGLVLITFLFTLHNLAWDAIKDADYAFLAYQLFFGIFMLAAVFLGLQLISL